jgi:hypothetical protein
MDDTWKNYIWPDWVPMEVRRQIVSFWSDFHRDRKDYLDNIAQNSGYQWGNGKMPAFGEVITVVRQGEHITGRFIHAWNNMARLVMPDGSYRVISSCDTYTKPEAAKWEALAFAVE